MRERDLDVIGIGSIMGEISPPRAGQRIGDAEHLLLLPSGSATIFITALAALGARAGFISRVGDDELGRWIVAELNRLGIDTTAVGTVPGHLTPIALASVDAAGEKTFTFYRFPGFSEPLSTLRADDVPDDLLARAAIFDLTEGSLRSSVLRETALTLARRAKALGLAVCVNPNYRPNAWKGGEGEARAVLREALALGELTIMNDAEARLITELDDLAAALRAIAALGPSVVVATRGGEAIHLLDRGVEAVLPIPPANVVFDVGAGDVFHAGFLARWRPGADAVACARFAAAASAIKIGREPAIANLPTAAEVEARLSSVGVTE